MRPTQWRRRRRPGWMRDTQVLARSLPYCPSPDWTWYQPGKQSSFKKNKPRLSSTSSLLTNYYRWILAVGWTAMTSARRKYDGDSPWTLDFNHPCQVNRQIRSEMGKTSGWRWCFSSLSLYLPTRFIRNAAIEANYPVTSIVGHRYETLWVDFGLFTV